MGLISRVSSRTYRNINNKMFRSALRLALTKAPLANGPLQAPSNLNGLHARNYARVQSKAWFGALTVGLVWLWMVRIPNSEQTFDYVKHVDLAERKRQWRSGVSSHTTQPTGRRLTLPSSPMAMMMMTSKKRLVSYFMSFGLNTYVHDFASLQFHYLFLFFLKCLPL